MSSINLKKVRADLPARREPHWKQLDTGFHIGYRKMPSGFESWVARVKHKGNYLYSALGPVTSINNYSSAAQKANDYRDNLLAGKVEKKQEGLRTIKDICEAYIIARGEEKDEAVRYEFGNRTKTRFKKYVYPSIGNKSLRDLDEETVLDWRNNIAKASSRSSANRHMRSLKAALNWGARQLKLSDLSAWRNVPEYKGAENARKLYLDAEQRKKIIDLAEPRLALILTALAYTGARGSEIRRTLVKDLNLTRGNESLRLLHHKGEDASPKERDFPLTNGALEFFKAQAEGKKPTDFLFTFRQGQPWTDNQLAKDVKDLRRSDEGRALAEKYGWHEPVVSYHFRHGVLADLLQAGIRVGTVANVGGTSAEYLERNYDKHIPKVVRQEIAGVTLI